MIYPEDVKGKKKKDPRCPKHHHDEGSLGAGSLLSNGVRYKQLVGCQHTKVSLSRRGLPANILRVNVFAIGVGCWRRLVSRAAGRVTGRLATSFIGSYRSTVHRGSQLCCVAITSSWSWSARACEGAKVKFLKVHPYGSCAFGRRVCDSSSFELQALSTQS